MVLSSYRPVPDFVFVFVFAIVFQRQSLSYFTGTVSRGRGNGAWVQWVKLLLPVVLVLNRFMLHNGPMSKINVLELENSHNIYLSSHPLEEVHSDNAAQAVEAFIGELGEKEIEAIVVLLPSHEIHDLYGEINLLEVYRAHGLEVLHYPLENFSVPDRIELFDETIRFIQEKLLRHSVLIHCMAGCGRTGMMAAGVLVRLGWSAADAIEAVRHSRPGSMDVLRQILFLRSYQRYLKEHRDEK